MSERLRNAIRDEEGFGLVETMIAVTILVIGLLAVSGLSLATAAQARIADLRSDQMVAGQSAIEAIRLTDFATVASGVDTVTSGGRTLIVSTTVVELGQRAKQVTVEVTPVSGPITSRSFSTVVHDPRSLPAAP